MEAEYLKANVGSTLTDGLAAVVLNKPEDPVEFLGQWLLDFVRKQESDAKQRVIKAQLQVADQKLEQQEKAREEKLAQLQRLKAEKQQILEQYKQKLAEQHDVDAVDLFRDFTHFLKDRMGASGVYVLEKDEPKHLKYIATLPSDEFLLEDDGLSPTKGVTWSLYGKLQDPKAEAEEEEPEAEEEEEAPADEEELEEEEKERRKVARKRNKEMQQKELYLQNVFLGPLADRVHFFKLPQPGSYYAVRIQYGGLLNEQSLQEAIDKLKVPEEEEEKHGEQPEEKEAAAEEEEDENAEEELDEDGNPLPKKKKAAKPVDDGLTEEERLRKQEEEEERKREEAARKRHDKIEKMMAVLPTKLVSYVVAVDTLGQNRAFSATQLDELRMWATTIRDNLLRMDREMFRAELDRRVHLDAEIEAEKQKKDKVVETERKKLEKEMKGAKPEDIQFRLRQKIVFGLKHMIAEFKTYNVFKGPLQVLQCAMYMLDYTKEEVADSKNKPEWKKIRKALGDELFQKLKDYDPRAPQKRGKKNAYAKVKNLTKLLEGLTYDDLSAVNYPLAEVFGFVEDALAVKKMAKEEREEKKKQDAEAAGGEAQPEAEEQD